MRAAGIEQQKPVEVERLPVPRLRRNDGSIQRLGFGEAAGALMLDGGQ